MLQDQLTTTSILALFQTSKSERQSFVADVLSRIESGDVNPLNIHLQVKCTEDIVKQLTSNEKYRTAIVEEAAKHGAKTFEYHNAKFEMKETGVKYDWSKCADPELVRLCEAQEKLDAEVKKRQDFLKTIPVEGLEVVCGDEVVRVYPPAKSSTSNVAVTLK